MTVFTSYESASTNGRQANFSKDELQHVLAQVDLLALAQRDVELKRVAGTNRGEWSGPCPRCGGNDRFNVWPKHQDGKGRFWCRQCNRKGDAVDYLREFHGLGFQDALQELGIATERGSMSIGPVANGNGAKNGNRDHNAGGASRISREFTYYSAAGDPLYKVVRLEPKEYKPRQLDGRWGYGDVERVLYNLPGVRTAIENNERVYFVEGEKTAQALLERGLIATTIPGGANGTWFPRFSDALERAHVVILRDQDVAGHSYGERVATELDGTAASLQVVDLPGLEYADSHGQDPEDWLEKGHTADDLREIADKAPPWREPLQVELGRGRAVRLLTLDELEALPPVEFLIDEIIPRGAVCMMYAPAESGKSFLALSWALKLAQTESVIYLAAEGWAGLGVRARAWRRHTGLSGGKLLTSQGAVPLMDETAVDALIKIASPLRPSLVVVDTLSASVSGADDSSSEHMRIFTVNCRRLAQETGAAVLILHHSLKSDATTFRGSTVLRDDVDAVMYLNRSANSHNLTLKCIKMKDAQHFGDVKYRLEVVELEGGESTCVAVALSDHYAKQKRNLNGTEWQALTTLAKPAYQADGISVKELASELGKSTSHVYKLRDRLIDQSYAEKREGSKFGITAEGLKFLS